MSVHIVTHCYAMKLPQYASFLRYQLESLRGTVTQVTATVCCCPEDKAVNQVLDELCYKLNSPQLQIQPLYLELTHLGRRAIGRNLVALSQGEDFVWFTDCDYTFRSISLGGASMHALDRLAGTWNYQVYSVEDEAPVMIFPQEIMVNRDHENGDCYAAGLKRQLDPTDFVPQRHRKAIGGLQIVTGAFARRHGYLPGTKWQRPQTGEPFSDFRDDVAYRRYCSKYGQIRSVHLPGVYRLRHSHTSYK